MAVQRPEIKRVVLVDAVVDGGVDGVRLALAQVILHRHVRIEVKRKSRQIVGRIVFRPQQRPIGVVVLIIPVRGVMRQRDAYAEILFLPEDAVDVTVGGLEVVSPFLREFEVVHARTQSYFTAVALERSA